MNDLLITNSLEGTPLSISATSMLSLDGMGTGAIRSSVFEINNSSSNVNFISHVWSCCSDLFFAEKAYGPKGRQGTVGSSLVSLLIILSSSTGILHLQRNRRYSSLNSSSFEDLSKSAFCVATGLLALPVGSLLGCFKPGTLPVIKRPNVKSKQVSAIDADLKNEVRCGGVFSLN